MKNVLNAYLTRKPTEITKTLKQKSEELKDSDLKQIVLLSKELEYTSNLIQWDMLKGSKNNHPEDYLNSLKEENKNYVAVSLTPENIQLETNRKPFLVSENGLVTEPITQIVPVNKETTKQLIKHAHIDENYINKIFSQYKL